MQELENIKQVSEDFGISFDEKIVNEASGVRFNEEKVKELAWINFLNGKSLFHTKNSYLLEVKCQNLIEFIEKLDLTTEQKIEFNNLKQ